MEDEVGPRGNERLCRAGARKIDGKGLDCTGERTGFRLDHVGQREFDNPLPPT